MFSVRLLPLPRASVGDIIFFRRIAKEQPNNASFESAVLDVSTIDSDVFHVGMIVNEDQIVHAVPNKGVCVQNLKNAIQDLKPDVVELGIVDVSIEQKKKAIEYAMKQARNRVEYNDLFLPNCINSNKKKSFYCCQLVVFSYKNGSLRGESPFLSHQLNFKDKTGRINGYWVDYYQKRGIFKVPQNESGSHPSKIRASPAVKLSTVRYCFVTKMDKLSIPSNFLKTMHYVGGAFSSLGSSKNSFKVFEPRSGKVLTEINSATKENVEDAVKLAEEAQQKWQYKSWGERSQILRNAGRYIRENAEILAEWEVIDNGKPKTEAVADVLSCADTFEYFSGVDLSGQFLNYNGDPSQHAYTVREPLGVVGAIGAWNYPIQTCTWKVAPAIACGNAIIYKPSPLAPVTSTLLAHLLTEAGLPDNLVNILQGGAETGVAICKSSGISKVSFTGSIFTGKSIAQNSATDNVKPVTLELGGKSACIVFEDADLEVATNGALMANFYSQGQVCSNASKVLVHQSIVDDFTKILVQKVKQMRIGDPFDESTHVGASISSEHVQKVLGFINEAVNEGAKLLCGGKEVKVNGLENGYYLSPCVLSNVNMNSRAYTEEIFGPVLLVVPFETDEQALKLANETEFGLAAGVFTKDLQKATVYSRKLVAGNVYVNTFNDTSPFVPFGGFKNSGFGRENGRAAIEYYTQIKSVFVNASGALDNPFQ